MPNWPALILSPALVLINLITLYAMVTPSCGRQSTGPMQWLTALSFLLCLLFTVLAWRNAHRLAAPSKSDAASGRAHFVARVSSMVGLLCSLVLFAMWVPQWILSPCAS
jgi:uncharacterized membrane protein (DUF4010 family)